MLVDTMVTRIGSLRENTIQIQKAMTCDNHPHMYKHTHTHTYTYINLLFIWHSGLVIGVLGYISADGHFECPVHCCGFIANVLL